MSTFVPNVPEKEVSVIISARESHLLKILRQYQFGKIMVYKANGRLVRVEPTESYLLNDNDEGNI